MDNAVEARLRAGAERFVRSAQPERVTIHDLYGDGWEKVTRRTKVGQEFMRLVDDAEVVGLEVVPRHERWNKKNHVEYRRR